jgi:hypothetical protein
MRSIVAASFLAAALAAGCAATVSADAYGPDLVTVSPGVQVIADYDESIFYSDGFYWRYDSGVWYRSNYYTGGWAYARPPVAVLRINQPYAYRHYRPAGWVGHPRTGYAGQPRYVAPAPTAGYRGTPPAAYRGTPPPAVRAAPAPAYRGAPPPAYRGAPPPSPVRPAAPPAARPAPGPHSRGWRGN